MHRGVFVPPRCLTGRVSTELRFSSATRRSPQRIGSRRPRRRRTRFPCSLLVNKPARRTAGRRSNRANWQTPLANCRIWKRRPSRVQLSTVSAVACRMQPLSSGRWPSVRNRKPQIRDDSHERISPEEGAFLFVDAKGFRFHGQWVQPGPSVRIPLIRRSEPAVPMRPLRRSADFEGNPGPRWRATSNRPAISCSSSLPLKGH